MVVVVAVVVDLSYNCIHRFDKIGLAYYYYLHKIAVDFDYKYHAGYRIVADFEFADDRFDKRVADFVDLNYIYHWNSTVAADFDNSYRFDAMSPVDFEMVAYNPDYKTSDFDLGCKFDWMISDFA